MILMRLTTLAARAPGSSRTVCRVLVEPVSDECAVPQRLDVDVAGALTQRFEEDEINELDGRRLARGGQEVALGFTNGGVKIVFEVE